MSDEIKARKWTAGLLFVAIFILGVMVGMMIEKSINPDKKSVEIKTIQYEQQKAKALLNEEK